jgi:hypothetical protein
MPPAVFEPAISADEQPQTCALDRAAIGTGILCVMQFNMRERATKGEVSVAVTVAAFFCYTTASPSRGNLSYEVDKICDKKIARICAYPLSSFNFY